MAKLSEEIIEELVRQKLEGKSYTLIRTNLGDQGLNQEEVRETINTIDERVLLAEIGKQQQNKSRQLYLSGLILAVLGLILTIANGFILTHLPKYVIYSPFFAGVLLMLYGRKSRNKKPVLYEKGPGQIKRRRPYK